MNAQPRRLHIRWGVSLGLGACLFWSACAGSKKGDAAAVAEEPEAPPMDIPAKVAEAVSYFGVDDSKAERILNEVLDYEKNNPLATYHIGVLREREGDAEAATKVFKKLLKKEPRFGLAQVGIARILLREGDRAGAQEKLQEVDTDDKLAQADAKALLSQILVVEGQLELAQARALEALYLDETNVEARLALAMGYRRQNRPELARLAIDQALSLRDDFAPAYNELGMLLMEDDQKSQAVQAFERAVALAPGNVPYLNNLGALKNEVGGFRAAITAMEEVTSKAPDVPEYYLNLGNAYRGDQRYVDASKAYQKAMETGTGTPLALYNLGVLYLDNEFEGMEDKARYQQSIDYLSRFKEQMRPAEEEAAVIDEYIDRANTEIEKIKKREERDARRAAKKAEREARKKAEEEEARRLAEEEAAQQAAEGGDAPAEGDGDVESEGADPSEAGDSPVEDGAEPAPSE